MCLLAAPLLYSASWRRFAGPTIFFYMTFIHYPSLLSPPGAVLFGFYVFFLSRHGYERR
jgi:hypothetical protein